MWSHWDNDKTGGYFFLSSLLHVAFVAIISWLNFAEPKALNQGTIEIEFASVAPGPSRLGQQTETKDESNEPIALAPKKVVKNKTVKKVAKKKSQPKTKKAKKVKVAKKPAKTLPSKTVTQEEEAPQLPSDIVVPVEKKTKVSDSFADEVNKRLQQADLDSDLNDIDEDFNDESFFDEDVENEIAQAEQDWMNDQKDEPNLEEDSEDNTSKKIQLVKQTNNPPSAKSKANQQAIASNTSQKGSLRNNLRYGVPNGVRDISELRAMPGNRPPSYDLRDRLAKKEGKIILQAYVTKNGQLEKFRLLQSTGHRSLDKKTLKAFKKYRFQRGQDGWVKMAFIWDLKGDEQQYPTRLRRRAQYNKPTK